MATSSKQRPVEVVLEIGKRRCFASAVGWPGWCRSGRTASDALDSLASNRSRYAPVAVAARVPFVADDVTFTVVDEVTGNATTDFGAPAIAADIYSAPLYSAAATRQAQLVLGAWTILDEVLAAAPDELRKGPRGGGRDTATIAQHVHDAESAYARKMGISTRGLTDVRAAIADALHSADTYMPGSTPWPPSYAAMRIAWHALDHAWEIEDRS